MEYRIITIKGVQAGRPYYISMIAIWQLMEILEKTNQNLPVMNRAQRQLNKGRLPEIRDYILNNPSSYVFSAVTLCIDGVVSFIPDDNKSSSLSGMLSFTTDAHISIIDGQHRLAALKLALEKNPKLGFEHMPVVLFFDFGLERSQQMFSDLNRRVVKPTKSLNILYDKRDPMARLVINLVDTIPIFKSTVELERATISMKSSKLFTLSTIYSATTELLRSLPVAAQDEAYHLAVSFWTTLEENIPLWSYGLTGMDQAREVRMTTICTQAVTLIALGRAGAYLFMKHHEFDAFSGLTNLSWLRDNPDWQGMLIQDQKVSGTRAATQALSQYLIRFLS